MTVDEFFKTREINLQDMEKVLDELLEGERKVHMFCLNMTPTEYAKLTRFAKENGISKALVMRLALMLLIGGEDDGESCEDEK